MLIRNLRLNYLIRLLCHGPVEVVAILAVTNRDGKHMPWTDLIIEDLCFLYTQFKFRLAELGDPRVSAAKWMLAIKSCPADLKELVCLCCDSFRSFSLSHA